MESLRLGSRVRSTTAEGPGRRYAVWLQGCRIRCPGCCNPQFFDAAGGGSLPVATLLEEVAGERGIEGATVLGGEPFDQPGSLGSFLRGVQGLGLSTVVFTGYLLEELRAVEEARRALEAIDLLVDGPYRATHPETRRRWAGSTNQRFHFLTSRYAPGIEVVEGLPHRTVEVAIGLDGRVTAHGWPEFSPARR
jgi:anaerobic ribonucleoside-triphosphate reductase activating protein